MTLTTANNNPLLEILETGGRITLEHTLSKEKFTALSARFPDLQMEREANGKTNVMSPVKLGSGERESIVLFHVHLWKYKNGNGIVLSPSTGIELPDGSIKSPDCAWVSDERLAALPEDAGEDFLRAIPDFVAEIRSSSDRLTTLKKKMAQTWIAHGVRLGWLIDPYDEKVYIYRQGREVEVMQGFAGKKLSGEDVMPGMELPLDELRRKK
ncbi:MAG: Uma2 family endonuclease [Saprospiraceae bacterium]|nr:MAG: Uma2 family endonuclease [Saprospiraceae bacterium]